MSRLFGSRAYRMSTEEWENLSCEMDDRVGHLFDRFSTAGFLASKTEHGDIDILAMGDGSNPEPELRRVLGDRLLEYSRNGPTISLLYDSEAVGRAVHVDLIISHDRVSHETNRQYFRGGDISAVLGIVAKRLHFKYGTKGFFKRFRDCKGLWHDIPISADLSLGLLIMGYPDPSRLEWVSCPSDVVGFVASSPLVDSRWFAPDSMNCADRQSVRRRSNIDEMCERLRDLEMVPTITDEDHFFKHPIWAPTYEYVERRKKEIDEHAYRLTTYDGNWVMGTFGVPQGPAVGRVLRELDKHFGEGLEGADPELVEAVVVSVLCKLEVAQ